jgi:DNA modification methylase
MPSYRGDCRSVLPRIPADAVDVVVTGLPFWCRKNWGWSGAIGQERTFDEYLEQLRGVFGELRRIVRDDGSCWAVTGDPRGEESLGQAGRILQAVAPPWFLADLFVWVYQYAGAWYHQHVAWLRPERTRFPTIRPHPEGTVWHLDLDQTDITTFPAALVERCLELAPGQVVLDPFGGTGTVARVAYGRGLECVSIDGRDACPT